MVIPIFQIKYDSLLFCRNPKKAFHFPSRVFFDIENTEGVLLKTLEKIRVIFELVNPIIILNVMLYEYCDISCGKYLISYNDVLYFCRTLGTAGVQQAGSMHVQSLFNNEDSKFTNQIFAYFLRVILTKRHASVTFFTTCLWS